MRGGLRGLILVAAVAFGLPAIVNAQAIPHCRAKPALLDLGAPLTIARQAVAESKRLKIMAISSSSIASYGVSNPAYAYPTQLWRGLDKALPGVDVDILSRGIGDQDVEEMAARIRVEMQSSPPSLVIWQVGTNAAIHRMPIDQFKERLRDRMKLGKSLGADFVLMNLQYVPAVVAIQDKEAYERTMASVAKEFGAGLFRRYDIMRSWYEDGMPYAQFVQLDGVHLNDFGQKCIGQLLTKSILGALTGP